MKLRLLYYLQSGYPDRLSISTTTENGKMLCKLEDGGLA